MADTNPDAKIMSEEIDDATRASEAADATKPASAGSMPTPEEERAADGHTPNKQAGKVEKDFNKMGANVPGEGQVDQ